MNIDAIIIVAVLGLGAAVQEQEAVVPPRGDDESWFLIGLLAEKGIDADVATLTAAARRNEDPYVRWVAIELLAQWRPDQFRELFAMILEGDDDRLVRETAAMALLDLGDERGAAALREFLKDAQPPRDLVIASRLAEAKDYGGYEVVREAARSKFAGRRADAARALPSFISQGEGSGENGMGPAALLLELVNDQEATVRKAAIGQLVMAVSEGLESRKAEDVAGEVANSDTDPEVRQAAELQLHLLRNQKLHSTGCPH